MFKNTLFLKIILVFTLPALGMMYFSTVLVYEKIQSLSEIKNIEKNIQYIEVTENLLHSLQKERGYTVTYISSMSKDFNQKMYEQRKISDQKYKKFFTHLNQPSNSDTVDVDLKKIQSLFYNLDVIRLEIDNRNIHTEDILAKYSIINAYLLESLHSIKHVEYAAAFNAKFSYIMNLLTAKEHAGIERALTSMFIIKKEISNSDHAKASENYTIQDINLTKFISKATVQEVHYLNTKNQLSQGYELNKIREQILKYHVIEELTLDKWWKLSTSRINAFEEVYLFSSNLMYQLSKQIRNDANINQILSLIFLFVSFATLISLLFVLKNIIFNEQKSYNKINKQREVYKLLNTTNNFLLTINDEKKLYQEICKLISLTNSMSFGFVYKVSKQETTLIAQEGKLKDIVNSKLQEKAHQKNLLTKAIDLERNIIVDSFDRDNISVLTDVAKEYNLKSAAAFPIKRFNHVIAVLVLYSNEIDFFDEDIEILFNNMINDMTHALEKLEYEQKRLEQEQEIKIASYAFESNEPMIITDESVNIIKANQAFCSVMGYSKEDIIGKNPSIFKSQHHNKSFYEDMWQNILKQGSWSGELYNTKRDKELIPLRSTITAIKNSYGDITHYLAQYIDISEQIDKQKVLEYQATHDNLTGLPNRLLLMDRIERALTKIERHKIVGGLIFIDLDNFKEVNDTLGHEIGDKLLILVAKRINETIRKEDTIARIGGDEFIVLADHIGYSLEEARENMHNLTKKIKLGLNSIIEIDGYKNISTPSIGVTLFNDSSTSIQELIKQADTAMYEAKKQGKNSIAFFN